MQMLDYKTFLHHLPFPNINIKQLNYNNPTEHNCLSTFYRLTKISHLAPVVKGLSGSTIAIPFAPPDMSKF